jgi:hypothetical protein
MIKLTNTRGEFFQLLKQQATDALFCVKKKDIIDILQFKKSRLPLYYNSVIKYSFMSIKTEYKNGLLRLGCHRFDRKTSRIIVRWANTK